MEDPSYMIMKKMVETMDSLKHGVVNNFEAIKLLKDEIKEIKEFLIKLNNETD